MIIFNRKKIVITLIILLLILASIYMLNLRKETMSIQTSAKSSKYEILVDVEESKLYLFEEGNLTETYKCSGRKMVNTISNRYLENYIKRYLGRRFWRKMDGAKCSMGAVWNTWHSLPKLIRMGKLTWLYKNEQ
jgi:hypothetical protein